MSVRHAEAAGGARAVLAIAAGVGLLASVVAVARVPNLVDAPVAFLGLYAAAFACYVAGALAFRGAPCGARGLGWLVGIALASRLVLMPSLPTLSTDAYRYVWDARVAAAGIDPYAYPPTAPELAALRDDRIFPRLNHAGWRTIYPPGAQAFFRAVYGLAPDSVLAMKAAIAAAELGALLAVGWLLRRVGQPPSQLVLYAWNPLVLVEVWGTGHLDGLVLPAVVGATLAAVAGRPATAGAALAAGALVKLYPAALLPLLVACTPPGRPARRVVAAFVATVLAGYGLGALVTGRSLGSLPRYLQEETFNPGLARTLVDHPAASIVAALAWLAWATWRARAATPGAAALRLTGGLTVLAPNVFPWYALWIVPFLALAPSSAWLAFTGTVVLAYTFFLDAPWHIPLWARVVEFLPLLALLARRRRVQEVPAAADVHRTVT
jgi:hypothetical protein